MRTWLFAAAAAAAAMAAPAVRGEDRGGAGQTAAVPAEVEHGFAPALAAYYIADLQQQLAARGYYAGRVDGRMSPVLRTAISVYQSDVGMRVTGVPDLAVVNMLRFGPEVRATIQPLGGEKPEATDHGAAAAPTRPETRRVSVPEARLRPSDVPPYEAPDPFRYPAPDPVYGVPMDETGAAEKPRRAEGKSVAKSEEPPLPKAAPQPKVESSPLPPGNEGSVKPRSAGTGKS